MTHNKHILRFCSMLTSWNTTSVPQPPEGAEQQHAQLSPSQRHLCSHSPCLELVKQLVDDMLKHRGYSQGFCCHTVEPHTHRQVGPSKWRRGHRYAGRDGHPGRPETEWGSHNDLYSHPRDGTRSEWWTYTCMSTPLSHTCTMVSYRRVGTSCTN